MKQYNFEEYAARRYDLYVLFDVDSHRPLNFKDWDDEIIQMWKIKLNL